MWVDKNSISCPSELLTSVPAIVPRLATGSFYSILSGRGIATVFDTASRLTVLLKGEFPGKEMIVVEVKQVGGKKQLIFQGVMTNVIRLACNS